MDTPDLLAGEKLRAEIYALLSECYGPPKKYLADTAARLTVLVNAVWPETVQTGALLTSELNQPNPYDRLEVDHARLFVGPYHLMAAPYGSVYLEGERKLMGSSTLDVLRRYRATGLKLADDFKETPDHIRAELEFMNYLICKECEAMARSADREMMDCIDRQRMFLEFHLGLWVPEFTGAVLKNAETHFYRTLATYTRTVVAQDLADCRRIQRLAAA